MWQGDKEAVRYLMAHDATYLTRFRAFISECELAARTVAPVGDLWPQGITALAVAQGGDPESTEEALSFWHNLIKG